MNRHALITGGTGFLGLNIILQLLELDWKVTALHRESSDMDELQKLPIERLCCDLLNQQQLVDVFPDNVDVVFHVAGDTNMWWKNNDRQYQTNVTATDVVSEVAIAKGVKKFIHTSSISAYGFHDEAIDEQTPSTALKSEVNYLETKYLGEQLIKNKVQQGRLDAVIMNPCAIIGAYDKHNWAQLFFLIDQGKLPGVPSGEGSYCHVKAVAEAHINAVDKGKKGENYILGGVDHSFLEVVSKIGQMLNKSTPKKTTGALILKALGRASNLISFATNKEPDMTPEKALMVTKRVLAHSEKAVKDLGYNDKIKLDEMLKDCFDWLTSRGYIS